MNLRNGELCSLLAKPVNHHHKLNIHTYPQYIYTTIHTPILTGRDPYLQLLERTRVFTKTLHTLPFTNVAGLWPLRTMQGTTNSTHSAASSMRKEDLP